MKLRLVTGLVLFLTFFLAACEDKIPIKEFSKAKEAIVLAQSVKAEQFSPLEFKEANDRSRQPEQCGNFDKNFCKLKKHGKI